MRQRAVKNFPAYQASDYDPNSAAAQAIMAAGFPPDIVVRNASGVVTDSLWLRNYNSYWEITACQWQKRLDPTYDTYDAGVGNYDFASRLLTVPGLSQAISGIESTGKIKKPLLTVAGTMDALLPIQRQAREYDAAVNASRKGNNDQRNAQYRLYEVQNGNHIESYASPSATALPYLVEIQPYAHKAFDALVDHVENNVPLPPSQCIAKGGSILQSPAQAGHCAILLDPTP
jgi:hypothetical protein